MGAMENKGLNIFNSRYILADPETATDADFDAIAAVVAHEYFHNWSGNRVTCRDWFQLSLKEGFTVFRDQSFSADMGSAAVKRIEDVRVLRMVQFPEDSGPLSHPVRPDSYMEISNFYTATVYNKGAELIRMFHTVLGPENFRAGTDLYFDRHDGEAATCDDFVKALEDASGVDLSAFKVWYSQAGTPQVEARLDYDAETETATLHLQQRVAPTPGHADKKPMPLPLRTALIGEESAAEVSDEQLIVLDQPRQSIRFDGVKETPLLSINRGFSAPVVVHVQRRGGELERLAQSDSDPFARYEAMQELAFEALLAGARGEQPDFEPLIRAARNTLRSNELDPAFKAEAILLPQEGLIAERIERDRSGCSPPVARGAAGRSGGRVVRRPRQGAGNERRLGLGPVAARQGHSEAPIGRAGTAFGGRRAGRCAACQGAVRCRRQYDGPAGGAGRARFARRPRA